MNAKELHKKLKQRIMAAQLDDSDLKVVAAYLDDENKYYELLAACFTRLSNNHNLFFIDVLKNEDGSPIENEYLGFLLSLASKNNQLINLPQENISEEAFYKISARLLKEVPMQYYDYVDFLRFLKSDDNLKKYANWLSSNQNHYIYASFFSLLFDSKGRTYLDSICSLTFERPYLFNYANFVLRCYSFYDEKLNKKVLDFSNALSDLAHGQFDQADFDKFRDAAVALDQLLQKEPYAQRFSEEKNKMLKRMGLYTLSGVSIVGVLAVSVMLALLCAPVLTAGLLLAAAMIFSALCFTALTVVETVYAPKEDATIIAKQILNQGQRYGQFFEKQKSQREASSVDVPVIDFSCI